MEVIKRASNSSIRMGKMSVSSQGDQLRTLLGSCVGLALFDRQRKVGGLAHIVLPASRGETGRPGTFVDTAIPMLIEQMEKLAGRKLNLTARIAGGASMFSTAASANIGQQNVDACERALGDLTIRIVGRHCGGEQGRRMSLDTQSGKVVIERVGEEPIDI